MHRRLPSFATLSLVLTFAACGSSPEAAIDAPHNHQHTTMVTVTDDAVLPSPAVKIPILSTVVWRNRGNAPMRIEVAAASCGGCDTVLGFTPVTKGARSADVAPGAIATLCFHQAGVFPFVAHVGSTELRGTIEVAAAP